MLSHFELSRLPAVSVTGEKKEAQAGGLQGGITDKVASIFQSLKERSPKEKLEVKVHPEGKDSQEESGGKTAETVRARDSNEDLAPHGTDTVPKHDARLQLNSLAGVPRAAVNLHRKLVALRRGPAHHTIDTIELSETGEVRVNSTRVHMSLGLGLHKNDTDIEADVGVVGLNSEPLHLRNTLGAEQTEAESDTSGSVIAASPVVAPGSSTSTTLEPQSSTESSTASSSTNTGSSVPRLQSLARHGHVLGSQILDHMARHRRWKTEASGALMIDDDIRQLPHCCPQRECIFSLLESRVYGYLRSSMAVLPTLAYSLFTPMISNFGDRTNSAICYFFVFTALFFLAEIFLQQIALGCAYFKVPWSYVNIVATAMLTLGCFGIFFGETFDVQFLEICRCGLTL